MAHAERAMAQLRSFGGVRSARANGGGYDNIDATTGAVVAGWLTLSR